MSSFNDEYREVDFAKYCPDCKYINYPEDSDICDECLRTFTNVESCVPVNFKEATPTDPAKEYKNEYSQEEKNYMKAVNNIFEV